MNEALVYAKDKEKGGERGGKSEETLKEKNRKRGRVNKKPARAALTPSLTGGLVMGAYEENMPLPKPTAAANHIQALKHPSQSEHRGNKTYHLRQWGPYHPSLLTVV